MNEVQPGGMISGVPVLTGGVLAEWGPPRKAIQTVQGEIRAFNGRTSDDDYCIDLAC